MKKMLKHRIIPTLLLLEGRLVKGKVYGQFKETGLAKTAIRVYSSQDSDELVLLNIDKGKGSFSRLLEILKDASGECFMPLTAGGGGWKMKIMPNCYLVLELTRS